MDRIERERMIALTLLPDWVLGSLANHTARHTVGFTAGEEAVDVTLEAIRHKPITEVNKAREIIAIYG